ncbi:MAG: PsiF repeat-containing protein [Gallionellaceae bacterium]|nr:MAG: PsiF repeat-containing protein [Gallionellaceae bacterium]
MKKLIALAGLSLLLAVSAPSFAGAQQEKMKHCNKDAKEKDLRGDERKAFMKDCLGKKADAAPAADAVPGGKKSAQQEKMKACNQEAKDKELKGDERKKFMSACLKG